MSICAIAFDADDTLWHSQTHFIEAQARIDSLLAPFVSADLVTNKVRESEPNDLLVFGYGVKAYIISLLDAAISICGNSLPAQVIKEIIDVGRNLLSHPTDLLPDVQAVLDELSREYRIALITKGEAVHQEAKLASSGVSHYFSIVSVVAIKSPAAYSTLAGLLGVASADILMAGNSVRSDIIPALEAGFHTAYIPYPHLWPHELAAIPKDHPRFIELESIAALPEWLRIKKSIQQ